MKRARMEFIRGLMSAVEDLPDGAFLAVLEERGVSVDELAEIAKHDEQHAATGKQSSRKGGR